MTPDKCKGCQQHLYGDCPDGLVGAIADVIGYECMESGNWKLFKHADVTAENLTKRVLFLRQANKEVKWELWQAKSKLNRIAAEVMLP